MRSTMSVSCSRVNHPGRDSPLLIMARPQGHLLLSSGNYKGVAPIAARLWAGRYSLRVIPAARAAIAGPDLARWSPTCAILDWRCVCLVDPHGRLLRTQEGVADFYPEGRADPHHPEAGALHCLAQVRRDRRRQQ